MSEFDNNVTAPSSLKNEASPLPSFLLEQITTQAERGNGFPLKAILDQSPTLSERMHILEEVDSINERNRKANRFLPDLDIRCYSRENMFTLGSSLYLDVYHDPHGKWNTSCIYSERMQLQFLSWQGEYHAMERQKSKAWKR